MPGSRTISPLAWSTTESFGKKLRTVCYTSLFRLITKNYFAFPCQYYPVSSSNRCWTLDKGRKTGMGRIDARKWAAAIFEAYGRSNVPRPTPQFRPSQQTFRPATLRLLHTASVPRVHRRRIQLFMDTEYGARSGLSVTLSLFVRHV